MINFPDNPSNNQVFTSGNQTWVYDGTKWLAMGVAGGIYLPLSGGILTGPLTPAAGVVGVVDGSSAAAGQIGEYLEASTSTNVPLTTAVTANVMSLPLTAGDWNVEGNVNITGTGNTAVTVIGAISTVSAALPSTLAGYARLTVVGGTTFINNWLGATGFARVSLAAPATVYLVGYAAFTTGPVNAQGTIRARRAR